MNYKYDEESYAKLIFEKGFQTRFVRYELIVLVKYLKHIGYKKKETEEFLYEFCEKYIQGFNKVKYYKIIDGAIRDGRKVKNKLLVINKIDIMKSEIEHIDSLKIDHEYKKLLLSFLVSKKISMEMFKLQNGEAKLSTYFNGNRKKFNEVFKTANIVGRYKVDQMVSELVDKGILDSIIKGDIILKFIEDIKECEDDEIFYELTVKEFKNVGYVFDYYKGENRVKKCEECGCLIKQKNNKQLYCDECAKDIKNKQNKEYYHKNKNLGK